MDDTLFRTLLFDFYGDLLTEKQRDYYDLHYNQDLSLQEIAEQYGTSRQAVWDIIRRSEQSLREIEEKTCLVRRAMKRRGVIDGLLELAESLDDADLKQQFSERLILLYD